MKELAEAQTLERMAQTTIVHGNNVDDLMINDRQYRLVANYRDAYSDDRLAARFSEFLEKYDYIVGDIAADQLRLHGLYEEGKTGVSRALQIGALQDYLYENINFGAPYFVLENLNPHVIEEIDEPAMHKPRRRGGRKHQNQSNSTHQNQSGPVIKEQKKEVANRQTVRQKAQGKAVTKGNNRKRRFEIRNRVSDEG